MMEKATVEQIKAEAQRRIEAVAPDWKQRNALAEMIELQQAQMANMFVHLAVDDRTKLMTGSESERLDSHYALWESIRRIRDASNRIEQDPPAFAKLAGDPRWPCFHDRSFATQLMDDELISKAIN